MIKAQKKVVYLKRILMIQNFQNKKVNKLLLDKIIIKFKFYKVQTS